MVVTPGSMTPAEVLSSLSDDYRLETLPDYPAPRVLDLGAHVGGFTLYALRRWPGASVEAYEPHPVNFARLSKDTQGASVDAWRCAVVGKGHPPGSRVRLYEGVNGLHECSTHADIRWPHCSQRLDVWTDVPALEASELAPCDVLKIDTEGCEVEILECYPHLAGVKALLVEPHAVQGDYAGQERQIRALARDAGFREVGKGIAWRFLR